MLEISGQAAGIESTMTKAIKIDKRNEVGEFIDTNPVSQILKRAYPEYLNYFVAFRKQRNWIKNGIGFGIAGPDPDLGVMIVIPNGESGVLDHSKAVRVRDLTLAIMVCAKLARTAMGEAKLRIDVHAK